MNRNDILRLKKKKDKKQMNTKSDKNVGAGKLKKIFIFWKV